MLQAEILVQYGMRSKAIERLQRIQELFPREEERNQELQKLYIAAGIEPQYAKRLRRRPPCAGVDAGCSPRRRGDKRGRRAMRRTSAAWRKWLKSRASFITREMRKEF